MITLRRLLKIDIIVLASLLFSQVDAGYGFATCEIKGKKVGPSFDLDRDKF